MDDFFLWIPKIFSISTHDFNISEEKWNNVASENRVQGGKNVISILHNQFVIHDNIQKLFLLFFISL